jgi:LAO/AO transport system kinase
MAEEDTAALAAAVQSGDRRALSRAITLVESTRKDHRAQANELLECLIGQTGGSIRLGISGAPGVGKSTFIEALGNHIVDKGHRVAVLTVDPSSTISGGSILGDKTRMETLARRSDAYIRPSPAGTTLGGVTRRSREVLLLCEAAGFDVVIVETVGVGQSETKVADMTDMFMLLLLPGGGDQLQGIKRGIMELADLVIVNKADRETKDLATRSAMEYRDALQLLHPRSADWKVEVLTCSALDNIGVDDSWEVVLRHHAALVASDELNTRRADQARAWMWSEVQDSLIDDLKADPEVTRHIPELEAAASAGEIPAGKAAEEMLNIYYRQKKVNGNNGSKS